MPSNLYSSAARRRPRERGIALIVVLWLLALMSLVATTFAVDTRMQAQAFRNETSKAIARAAADAGVHLGIRELLRENDEIVVEISWLRDGSPYEKLLPYAKLTISLQDEAGKIDINTAPEELIRGLGRDLKIDPRDWDKIADSILDWRDEDDLKRLNGAEDNAYEQAGLPYLAKNGYFQSIDELQQVLGVDHVNFRKIAQAITIYSGREAINPALAPRLALMALPGVNAQEVEALLATRETNRYDASREKLPNLTNVAKWIHSGEGPVITVRSTARTSGGGAFTREAVVWIPQEGKRRYWILDWRAVATQTVNITNDGSELKQ